MSKHLTHFCYPIRLVLHQHLKSHVAYTGIPPENSKHTRGQYQHLPSYPLLRLLWSKSDKTSSPERGFSTSITLELHLVQPHCTRIIKHEHHLWHHMRNLINQIVSDFDQSNLRRGYDGKCWYCLVCGLNFQVGCQDRLSVNSNADEALA